MEWGGRAGAAGGDGSGFRFSVFGVVSASAADDYDHDRDYD